MVSTAKVLGYAFGMAEDELIAFRAEQQRRHAEHCINFEAEVRGERRLGPLIVSEVARLGSPDQTATDQRRYLWTTRARQAIRRRLRPWT